MQISMWMRPFKTIARRYFVVEVFAHYCGSPEPIVAGMVAAGSQSEKNNVCLQLCKN